MLEQLIFSTRNHQGSHTRSSHVLVRKYKRLSQAKKLLDMATILWPNNYATLIIASLSPSPHLLAIFLIRNPPGHAPYAALRCAMLTREVTFVRTILKSYLLEHVRRLKDALAALPDPNKPPESSDLPGSSGLSFAASEISLNDDNSQQDS